MFGRTSLAAVVLLAVAIRTRARLQPALREWRPVLAFAAIEMVIPWLLLTNAEEHLPSGLTGLLVACVPLAGAILAFMLGDHSALRPVRVAGIAVGLGGVALLVGGDLRSDSGIPWLSVGQVMLVCVCYAIGPFIISRRLSQVPSIGVVAVALTAAALVTAPLAWFARPTSTPPASALWSIRRARGDLHRHRVHRVLRAHRRDRPDARATLITFVNPAVAVVLGAVFLDEKITAATIGGFVLVLAGCWLATRPTEARREALEPRYAP